MSQATASAGSAERNSVGHFIRNTIGTQNLSLLIALLLLIAIFGAIRPDAFFLGRTLTNIVLGVSILGVLAIAQTMVIVSGGLDISVGSTTGLCTLVAALAIETTGSPWLAVIAALVAGGIAGCANGLIITLGRVNPVITTLGTMAAFRGLALIISNGRSIAILNDDFRWLGSGFVGFLPMPVFLMLIVAALFFCFMRFTIMGRNVYAMGGNPVVARLAGISLTRYRIAIYTVSGVAAGLAGVILAARTGSGQPVSGSEGLELEAITAAILGGCALAGGKGTIFGAVLAVLILGVLKTGMLLIGLQSFYQDVAKGALLVGAVMIQELRFRRSAD